MQWRDFWNGRHHVYVNDRHRDVHYAGVADDIVAVLPSPDAVVLDHGCGEALHADHVAAHCARLYLCEAAETVRQHLRARFAHLPNMVVLSDHEVAELADGSLDLVVVNSVLQYLTPEQLNQLLRLWRCKLRSDGLLVLADVLPPETDALKDARALLSVAVREGFLLGALRGLAALLISDYARLRRRLGLTRYAQAELEARLRRAGFDSERRARNFGYNQQRMTFLARPNPANTNATLPDGVAGDRVSAGAGVAQR